MPEGDLKPSAMHLGPEAWGEAVDGLERYLETKKYSRYVTCTLVLTVAKRILASQKSSEQEVNDILKTFEKLVREARMQ